MDACMSKKKKKKKLASAPENWSVVPSSVTPVQALLHGSPAEGSWETSGPEAPAIHSEPPRIPCLHCWCSAQLPARPLPVFIGSGDCYWSGWQLSARLSAAAFPCSLAAPRRCPTSQHYCSCWAFCLKSFPAVSWYGKPLKLAPDCSVYFSLDKRQNTLPAACREEGGPRRGDGERGTQAGSLTEGRVPRQDCEKAQMR